MGTQPDPGVFRMLAQASVLVLVTRIKKTIISEELLATSSDEQTDPEGDVAGDGESCRSRDGHDGRADRASSS